MSNWIKCTDKLPDYDTPVLWYSEDGNCHVEDLDKDGNPWLDGCVIEGFEIAPVTHWQPLPAPPADPHSQQEINVWDLPMDN